MKRLHQNNNSWLISVCLAFLALSIGTTFASPFISQNQPEWVQRSLEREFGSPPRVDAREFMKALMMVLQEGELAKMGAKNMEELFTEIEEKRAPFSSWGGKRSDQFDRHIRANSFSAWGGKRDDLAELIKAKLEARSRRNSADSAAIKVIRPARAAFSAWGGK